MAIDFLPPVNVRDYEVPVETPEAEDPSLLETFGAAFSVENTIGSLYADSKFEKTTPYTEEAWDFDPFSNIDGYEDYYSAFAGSYSVEDVNNVKAKIDQEREHRRILEASGWTGIGATIIAGVADPVALFVGGATGGLGWAGRGASLVSKTAKYGALATASEVPVEMILQDTQYTRTQGETMFNLLGTGIFGGLLGGGVSALKGRKLSKLQEDRLEADIQTSTNEYKTVMNQPFDPDSIGGVDFRNMDTRDWLDAGAAKAGKQFTAEELMPAGKARDILEWSNKNKATKLATQSNMNMRLAVSPYKSTSNGVLQLLENNMILNINYGGTTSSALRKATAGINFNAIANKSNTPDITAEALQKEFNNSVDTLVSKSVSVKEATEEAYGDLLKAHIPNEESVKAFVRDYDNNFKKEFERKGVATNTTAERYNKVNTQKRTIATMLTYDEGYAKYRQGLKGTGKKGWNRRQFSEKVGQYLITGKTPKDESIKEMVDHYRALMDDMLEDGKSVGLFGDIEDSSKYYTRVYHLGNIKKYKDSFKNYISDIFVRNSKRDASVNQKRYTELKPKVKESAELLEELEIQEYAIKGKWSEFEEGVKESGVTPEVIEDYITKHKIPRRQDQLLPESPTKAEYKDYIRTSKRLVENKHNKLVDKLDTYNNSRVVLTKEEALKDVDLFIENIEGNGGYFDPSYKYNSLNKTSGQLKQRTFNIDNSDLIGFNIGGERVNWISTDAEKVALRYIKEVTSDIEWRKGLQRIDPTYEKLDDLFHDMDREFEELVEAGGDRTALKETLNDNKNDLQVAYELFRGSRGLHEDPMGVASNITKTLSTSANVAMLGKILISALPDIARSYSANGVVRGMLGQADYLANKLKDGAFFKDSITNKKAGASISLGWESMTNNTVKNHAGVKGLDSPSNRYQEILERIDSASFTLGGMSYGNDALRVSNAYAIGDHMIEGVLTGGLIKDESLVNTIAKGNFNNKEVSSLFETKIQPAKRDAGGRLLEDQGTIETKNPFDGELSYNKVGKETWAKWASLGLDENDIKEVFKQYVKYGEKRTGLHILNVDKWDNPSIKDKFEIAMSKDSEQIIQEMGIGDKPNVTTANPYAKLIFKFQSFILGSMNKTVLPLVQGEGKYVAPYLIAGTSFGITSTYLKEWLKGEDANFERYNDMSSMELVLHGMDRAGFSGMLSYGMQVNDTIGGGEGGRYGQARSVKSWLGPSASTVENVAYAIGALNPMSETPIHKVVDPVRKLTPLQNNFYLENIFDYFEEEAEEFLK